MRIVVKVGTSTLTHSTGKLNVKRTEELCNVLSDVKNADNEVILVTSGAIGMGIGKLSLNSRPKDIPSLQAVAAVGQCELMYCYDKMFSKRNQTVAQILLTGDDFNHNDRYKNFINTMNKLLALNVIPVVNENDTVATSEIKVGDNDTLSALVAKSVNADLLILLSDIDGLFTTDPKKDKNAKLIKQVDKIDKNILSLGGDKGSELGTGGMKTKLYAATICTDSGVDMIIANGKRPSCILDILKGKPVGTKFISKR